MVNTLLRLLKSISNTLFCELIIRKIPINSSQIYRFEFEIQNKTPQVFGVSFRNFWPIRSASFRHPGCCGGSRLHGCRASHRRQGCGIGRLLA